MREIDFSNLVPRSEEVEEDRLVHSFLAEFEVIPMNRRFGAVLCRHIEPGASDGQNIQNAVEQPAGVPSRSADMWLRWQEVFLDNFPEIIVNFQECHDHEFYPRCLIIIGSPRRIVRNLFQLEQVFDRGEQLDEFGGIPIVGTQLLSQEQNCYKLVLGICSLGIFAGIER